MELQRKALTLADGAMRPNYQTHVALLIPSASLCCSSVAEWNLEFIRRFRKIVKSYYQICRVCLSVRPSVATEQLGSHWTDFHEIWNLLGAFAKL